VEWLLGERDIVLAHPHRVGEWLVFIPLCFMVRRGELLTKI
jgi:hypothetical protein